MAEPASPSLCGTPFFVTGGTLRHDAPSYVERQADKELLEALVRGEFCYVLTSRQMGKSSLMVRTARKLRDQGIAVMVLDLTAIGQNLTPEQWYDGLLVRAARQLALEEKLQNYWDAHRKIGPCQRFFDAIRDVALAGLPAPKRGLQSAGQRLIIFVDEIDTVRSLPFSTDEFFAGVRECYNRRSEEPELDRLTFCLLGVAMPTDLIRDTRLTPFNIGRRIELHDFTAHEASVLAQGFEDAKGQVAQDPQGEGHRQLSVQSQRILQRALYWTSGHPYLTQRLCGEVLNQQGSNADNPEQFVDRLCTDLFLSARARERDDNLIFVREHLLRSELDRASLLQLYERVLRGSSVPDDETSPLIGALRLTGVVRVTADGVVGRNRIYSRVFDRKWVRANMPDAEVRRQRAAFRRGVVRATAVAVVIVAAMIAVKVLVAVSQAAKRRALAQSYLSQARAGRVSGKAGQRYESIQALREAHRHHAPDDVLRDEMIACLALVDISSRTNSIFQTNVCELNLDSAISATAHTAGSIVLSNVNEYRLLTTLPGFGPPVRRLCFGPKGPLLLAEYAQGSRSQIVLWDWQKEQRLFEVSCDGHVSAVDFSSESSFRTNGGKLAVGQDNGKVSVFALPRTEPVLELPLRWESGSPRVPRVLRFNPTDDLLAESGFYNLNVQIWDLSTGQRVFPLYHPGNVFDLSWHPQGEVLAAACADGCIYLWDINHTDKWMKKLIGHENGVTAITFNHRGTLLASAGLDETLRLWIPATERQMVRRLEGEVFEHLKFSSKDDVLLASLSGTSVAPAAGESPGPPISRTRLWDVAGDEYLALSVRTSPTDRLQSIDFSPNGRWLAATSAERTMIWDCSSGMELAALSLSHARAAMFSTNSRSLVVSTIGGLFNCPLNELTTGNQPRLEAGSVRPLAPALDELGAMILSTDRKTAAVVRQDKVWLVGLATATNTTRQPVATLDHYGWLALHPEGIWLAGMTAGSNSIHIWKINQVAPAPQVKEKAPSKGAARSLSATFSGQVKGNEHFVFSPDGKWLVTCCTGQFQFYRVGSWEQSVFSIPRAITSTLHAPIAFTQDGSVVALASSRYTIQLLKMTGNDAMPTRVIASLESPDHGPLEMLAFSPGGRHLAAATMNLTIQLWNLGLVRESLADLKLDSDWPNYPRLDSVTGQ